MNYKMIGYIIGRIAVIEGALLFLPMLVSFYYSENQFLAFLIPMIALLVIGFVLMRLKPKKMNIYAREGFVICGLAWIFMSLFGALPFIISGSIPNFLDAFFETVSGFSTTGASILTEIRSLPKSILFWRSFTHWIGGMGILTFMIALLPKNNGNAMNVMKAEVPGPKAGKVVSKISTSLRILYIIYFTITIAEIIVLFAGGMRFFDSTVTAFATAGTGGFSVLNNSIAGYNSPYVEWVLIVFMFLFGVNFNMYYFVLCKRFSAVYKDEELRSYILINVVSVLLIVLNISHMYTNLSDAVRDAFFNVNAVMSTTGYGTADFNLWPTFSKVILMVLMCVGGSAGSTAGGMKVTRIMLYIKQVGRDFRQMRRPNSVVSIRMNKRQVERDVMRSVNGYLTTYVVTIIASTLLLSLNGFDMTTTFSAVLSCVNNIGPGLELVGPKGNYAMFSDFSKLVLIFDMLAGRLELFPMLLLLSPSTWKKI